MHVCEQLVEAAIYLRDAGMPVAQLRRLHHFTNEQVTFASTCGYFGTNKDLRGKNLEYSRRLVFVADEHRRAGRAFDMLVSEAVKKWPIQNGVNPVAQPAVFGGGQASRLGHLVHQINGAASAYLKSASTTRAELYGTVHDRQIPSHLVEDSRVPFLGFAGPGYLPGGVVLLAINPGGGGDTYRSRTLQDAQLIPLIEAFAKSSAADAQKFFDAMSSNYAAQIQTWNVWRILHPVLRACDKQLGEVAYLNCFPFRTSGDHKPQATALRASWAKIIEPILVELKPSIVIALGKKAGGVAVNHFRGPGQLFVVPRTIGDSYVSVEAQIVLDSLRLTAT